VSGGLDHLIVSGPVLLAMPVAAAAGAITFLSPCCLPLVPGYLSYLTGMSGSAAPASQPKKATTLVLSPAIAAAGQGIAAAPALAGGPASQGNGLADTGSQAPVRSRVMLGTLLFILGFSALFAAEGVAFGSLGDLLRLHTAGLTRVLGALVIVLGLLFMGVFDRFTFAGRIVKPTVRPRAGLAGAPLLGVLFGLGWTPCTGPTLGAVMTLTYTSGTAVRGGLLAFVYALGIGVPFLIVAFAFQRGINVFAFARRHARLVTRIGGLMLIAVGLLEVTGAWAAAVTWLQVHWLTGYNAPF
jgi:cytochrome c-type biogenesis protein